MSYLVKAGSVDQSVRILALDSTTGAPVTTLVYNSAGIDLEYHREGADPVDIAEATLANLSAGHADGGFLHIAKGMYRLDLPDAAVAAGAKSCSVTGSATGVVFREVLINLVAFDPYDPVRMGQSALPNAAAEAAGGLYTRGTGAGQIEQDANGRINSNQKAIAGSSVAATNAREAALAVVPFVVQTGSTVVLVETNLTETTPNHYSRRWMFFVTGVLAGQGVPVFSYDGSGTFVPLVPLTDAPANGDTGFLA